MSNLEHMAKANNLRIECKDGAPYNEKFKDSTGYMVTLKLGRKRMTVPFYMGSAHTNEPSACDVISCLISDSTAAGYESFEEWASDYGYDTDSREAERTFKTCVGIGRRLRKFLGDDYQAWCNASD